MKKKKAIFVLLGLVLLIGIGVLYSMEKQNTRKQIVKESVEEDLRKIYNRNFTVIDVNTRWTADGDITDVKVKMVGMDHVFTIGYPVEQYDVIWELWDLQFQEEMNQLFKNSGLEINNIHATVGVQKSPKIPLGNLPSIQEVKDKYGDQIKGYTIDVGMLSTYPTDAEGKLKEHEKVFALVQEIERRGVKPLSLDIQYQNYNGLYQVYIEKGEVNPFKKPEDMDKVLYPESLRSK